MTGATTDLTTAAPITGRPLTVAVVARQFPVVSETFVLDHINGLLDCGHNVQVLRREAGNLSVTHGDYDPQRLAVRTTTWIPARNRIARAINKLKLLPRMPLRAVPHLVTGPMRADLVPLAAEILRLDPQPDLLHAHFGRTGEMLAVLRHHKVIQAPLVVSVHGFDVNRALAGSAAGFPHLFLQATRVIVTSAFMRQQTERLGCAAERIVQIPIGIDAKRFSFAPRQWRAPEALRMLSVARLVEQKGIARGILATAALIREGIAAHYTIVGDGPLRSDLEQLARDCGIADFVDFRGAQSRESVRQHYANSHLFLFPCTKVMAGDEEGQGIVLLEAQACGLPVLTTRHGGIPESVDDGQSAVVVADDTQAFVEGLRKLVGDAANWPAMGRAGRYHVERGFRYDSFIARTEAVYREVLGNVQTPGTRGAARV